MSKNQFKWSEFHARSIAAMKSMYPGRNSILNEKSFYSDYYPSFKKKSDMPVENLICFTILFAILSFCFIFSRL